MMNFFVQVLKLLILQASWSSLRSLRVSDVSELKYLFSNFFGNQCASLVNTYTRTAIFRMQTISL